MGKLGEAREGKECEGKERGKSVRGRKEERKVLELEIRVGEGTMLQMGENGSDFLKTGIITFLGGSWVGEWFEELELSL